MQEVMTLLELTQLVDSQVSQKQDYLADTDTAIKLVQVQTFEAETENYISRIMLNLEQPGTELKEQFGITETAHRQIAAKLNIPVKHYLRLMQDHPDLVVELVNALFDREPEKRMLRILNGDVRAFLSSSYKRLDNEVVLKNALTALVNSGIETVPLSCNVTDNKMYMKLLFPDESLQQVIGRTPSGELDIIHPMITVSNSEIGMGSFKLDCGFYRTFCYNGFTFGNIGEGLSLKRVHHGGQLIEGTDFSIVSNETRENENRLMISQTADVFKAITSPEFSQRIGDKLRLAKDSEVVINPEQAVEVLAKDFGLRDSEREGVLESFIVDQDYSLWGMANAITKQANNSEKVSYDRATELEVLGGKVLAMSQGAWGRIAKTEKIAA